MLKLPSFYPVNFKIFKNSLGQFVPNHPPKHVITSTNLQTVVHAGYGTEDDCISIESLILVLDISM